MSNEAISRAVACAIRTKAGLFTMMPEIVAESFWELAAQVLVSHLIIVWLGMREVNDAKNARAGAVGPFMLFEQSAYRAIGGHEAVKGDAVEDMRLAERIKKCEQRLVFARGAKLARLRMYDSLGAIVRGWSKNFYVSLGKAFWAAPFVGALVVLGYGAPWFLWAIAALARDRVALALASMAFAFATIGRIDLARIHRLPARHPYLEALGSLVVAYILLRSSVRAARKLPFEWKGRSV